MTTNLLVLGLIILSGCTHAAVQPGVSPAVSPTATPKVSPSPGVAPTAAPTVAPTASPAASPVASGVDLSDCDSTIKSQIGGLCTAYGGMAILENMLCQEGLKEVPDLSENHAFSLYDEYSVDAFAETVPGNLITTAAAWPRGYDSPKLKNYMSFAKHKINRITYLGDGETDKAIAALKRKHPVYIGLQVPADMATGLATIRPTSKLTSGGHAVAIVGYTLNSKLNIGGGYWKIKNSWGVENGDQGYQYLPFNFCDKSYCYLYEFESVE